MTIFVLDNSVTMRWCFQNAAHPYADSIRNNWLPARRSCQCFGAIEVSAVLAKSQKDGMLTALAADEFLATLHKLNITVDPESSDRILTDVHRLAITYRLTSYDASYLERPCARICLWLPSKTLGWLRHRMR